MKKALFFIAVLSVFFVLVYFNLGKFLDATVEPSDADLIVCLGGGDYKERITTTVALYEKGFSKSSTILLTAYVNSKHEVQKGILEDKRVSYIKEHLKKPVSVVLNKNLKNTADEVRYIKNYLHEHGLKKALIVTEEPHSRRILMLNKLISTDYDSEVTLDVVGSSYKHWNTARYYEDKYARHYAFSEVLKMGYALIVYGVIEKLGLLEWYEKTFAVEIQKSRESLTKELNFITS